MSTDNERNLSIVREVINGASMVEMGRQHGLTGGRIRQIVSEYCLIADRQLFSQMPASQLDIKWVRAHKQAFLDGLHAQQQPERQKPIETVLPALLPTLEIERLELTARTENGLIADDILTVGDLLAKTGNDLFRIPGLGLKSLAEIRGVLALRELKLKDEDNLLWLTGLSTQAIGVLKLSGLENREGAIAAIKSGALRAGKPNGCGRGCFNEICKHLGVRVIALKGMFLVEHMPELDAKSR